jgi:uncharacterized protein YhfF
VQTTRALVLDVGHRVLSLREADGTWRSPSTGVPVDQRPLMVLKGFVFERLGLALPSPSGARPHPAPHDFAFVLPPDSQTDAADARWFPLRALDQIGDGDALWTLYVETMLGGWEPPTRQLDVFHFGADARTAANLAHVVVKGRKRATALWPEVARFRNETIPTPGMVSVVTDGFGIPACVIRTERVDERRFADVDESVAKDEGEGDTSLDDWREGHRAYFTREGKDLGLAFGEDTIVMVERFAVLKILGPR